VRRQRSPTGGVEGFLSGSDGGIDILGGHVRHGGELVAGAGIVGFERGFVGASRCLAAHERLLQFAIEEFAYFGDQIESRRSHVSPSRMDADGWSVFCRAARGSRPTENLSQVRAKRKARGLQRGERQVYEYLTQRR